MEECVGDEKDDNNNIIHDEIEVTCLDVTPPDSMDRGAAEEKDDYDDKMMMKKRQNAQFSLLLLIWRKV